MAFWMHAVIYDQAHWHEYSTCIVRILMTSKKPLKFGVFLQTMGVIIPHTCFHTFAVLAQRSEDNDKFGNMLQVVVRHTCKTIAAIKYCGDAEDSPL